METIELLALPHEGFDLDLYALMPELRERLEHEFGQAPLWSFGTRRNEGSIASLTYWNTGGCILLTEEPKIRRDDSGWFTFCGHSSRDEVITLSLASAIRYLWVQGYGCLVDMAKVISLPIEVSMLQQDILYHIRGWDKLKELEYAGRLRGAREWAFEFAARVTSHVDEGISLQDRINSIW